MRRILFVDRTADYYESLLPELAERYDSRLCCNGQELLQELIAFRPELLVMDMSIPNCDPIGLLRVAQAMDICPQVLAVCCSRTDLLAHELVTFMMVKPFEREELLKRIRNMEQLLIINRQERLYILAGQIMQELGLKQSRVGFACLQDAALYLSDHQDCLFADELYPYIAKLRQGSAQSVEKAMSRSIEHAWKVRNHNVWQYYFGDSDRCPTNVRFLKTLLKAMNEAF